MAGKSGRTVKDALAEVAAWQSDEAARRKAELVEVDQEIGKLGAALEGLRQQLEALQKFRGELVERDGAGDARVVEKNYTAIFDALRAQSGLVGARAALAAAAEVARTDAALTALATSEAAGLYEEYRQFKTAVEPTLAALPESYRALIVAHHQQQAAKLREHVAQALAGAAPVDAEPLEIEVVYGVDTSEEGQPELLIAVLPVAEEVQSDWTGRAEDLQTHLAARVIQGFYQAVGEAGPEGAQALCGGHLGLLALEAEVVGARADLAAVLERAIAAATSGAPELQAARVTVTLREVPVDYLLPPEDSEDGADDKTLTEVHDA